MNELEFLLDIPILNNNNNKDTIWNQLQGSISVDSYDKTGDESTTYKLTEEQKNPKRVVVFKEAYGKHDSISNYYKDTIHHNVNINPYKKLLIDFENKGFEALRLEAADFAYLTNLGVYPLNRLWILRRFKDGDSVPDNLLDFGDNPPYPISTVVGWVPPDEENFFGVDFNEVWTTTDERVDEVLSKVLEQEFNFKTKTVIPVAGWGQGLLIGFLNEMGMTNFTYDEIPFGNPNVLQEAATRLKDPANSGGGLKSGLNVTLKTNYEQKFIGDIDPGSAMLDIIRNLTRMGTSDMIFFADKNSEIFDKIRNANKQGTSANAWWDVITTLVTAFLNAIRNLMTKLGNTVLKKTKDDGSASTESTASGSTASTKAVDGVSSIIKSAGKTILASTIAKWKWPLIGGLGVMTGENTTPWHLTIGNPNSPFVSFGNVKVTKINIDFKNELGFNDMPTKMDIKVDVDFGRNLGAQEIFALFNNGYTRVYDTIDKQYMSLAKLYKTSNGIKEDKRVSTVKDKNGVKQTK